MNKLFKILNDFLVGKILVVPGQPKKKNLSLQQIVLRYISGLIWAKIVSKYLKHLKPLVNMLEYNAILLILYLRECDWHLDIKIIPIILISDWSICAQHCKVDPIYICIPRIKTARLRSQFLHSCICERFIYSHDSPPIFCRTTGGPIMWTHKSLIGTWM